jgi:hypothetical protein
MPPGKRRIIIVGGGFAGLGCARLLARERAFDVLLIDRRNHHLFQPLLYQVAMAGLSPADIAVPIRSLLGRCLNVRVLQAEVKGVDLDRRRVQTSRGEYPYDSLVLATGAMHTYFGHEDWEPIAPGLKTLEQATEIRRRVLDAFEKAESETDPEERRALLTFVVVGGGATGVELAGAIGEMSRFTLARDFRNIDPALTRIILIEAGDRILPSFHPSLSSRATRDLERLGVQVWTQSQVTGLDELPREAFTRVGVRDVDLEALFDRDNALLSVFGEVCPDQALSCRFERLRRLVLPANRRLGGFGEQVRRDDPVDLSRVDGRLARSSYEVERPLHSPAAGHAHAARPYPHLPRAKRAHADRARRLALRSAPKRAGRRLDHVRRVRGRPRRESGHMTATSGSRRGGWRGSCGLGGGRNGPGVRGRGACRAGGTGTTALVARRVAWARTRPPRDTPRHRVAAADGGGDESGGIDDGDGDTED